MKRIVETFTDEEFNLILEEKMKTNLTWRSFLLTKCVGKKWQKKITSL